MKFRATVIASGNATAFEVPAKLVAALDGGARPPIAVTINGHTWRTRIARMRGQILIGISAANRAAASIAEGDHVAVDVVLDTAERIVALPPDLAVAMTPRARAAFERLPFGLRRKHVASIEAAKAAATRQRRIAKLVSSLA